MTLKSTPQPYVVPRTGLRTLGPIRDLPIRMQLRRAWQQADRGLVVFCAALLTVDLFFTVAFSLDTISALYQGTPRRLGTRWAVGLDWSYAEFFGYLKTGFIASVLLLIYGKRRSPIYLALVLIFVVALLDDVLRLHERVGEVMATLIIPQSFAGWFAQSMGELILWAALGLPLLAAAAVAFRRSAPADRANALILIGALGVLFLFAVGVDLVHEIIENELRFPGGGLVFTVFEEAGEQVTLSLICGLALLLYRGSRQSPHASAGSRI